ncbi:MAG: hypothetical protein HYZ63_03260 [Candidatus Andersenbacteria bacterium]|nr:hypothetical protein [Candidatus Andersenbacteria bacterium]
MKAQVISQFVYDGFMDFVHGGGCEQSRLLIPDANNLLIWVHLGSIYSSDSFDPQTEKYTIIREVDVPDDLVLEVIAFQQAQAALHAKISNFLPSQ